MRQRIQTLDGLRFIAALGVLWIHSWTMHGNPRFYIGKVDLADFLAIGANGVDLFFVISGFCMYYFYASKTDFNYKDFFRFLVKRWVRLSPAFYVITLIHILVIEYFYHQKVVVFYNLLHSIFYLNFIGIKYYTAGYFWTLTVEWEFYVIVPFLLIYQNIIGFKKTYLIIFGAIFFLSVVSVFIFRDQFDQLTSTILFRATEFGGGIIAARVLLKNMLILKKRWMWLIAFIVITYIGRVFISKPILSLSVYYYNLFKLIGFTLMGLGFSGILYLSLTSVKWLNMLLGNKLFKTMGRISYSFYLLHGLVHPVIANYVIKSMPFFSGIIAPVVTTILSAVILYPLAQLSYNLLEKPFLSIGNLTTK